MDGKSDSDMPNFQSLEQRITTLRELCPQLSKILKELQSKSKEADTYKKCFDGLLDEYAEALAESKFFALRYGQAKAQKEKLEEKQSVGPLGIVEVIEELRFEVDTLYDILKHYHLAVQKCVPAVEMSIMQHNNPKEAVEVLKKQLDTATLEASSRFLLENDLPTNQALKFSKFLEKNSFKTIAMRPNPDPNDKESMEMDT